MGILRPTERQNTHTDALIDALHRTEIKIKCVSVSFVQTRHGKGKGKGAKMRTKANAMTACWRIATRAMMTKQSAVSQGQVNMSTALTTNQALSLNSVASCKSSSQVVLQGLKSSGQALHRFSSWGACTPNKKGKDEGVRVMQKVWPSQRLQGSSRDIAATAEGSESQNWNNFVRGLPATLTGDVVYRASLFKSADANSDGVLSKEELRDFLNSMPRTQLSDEQIDKLIAAADTNKDGFLQIDEFMNLFKAGYEGGALSPFCD